MPCTTPPRGGATNKKAGHPEPAINGHRDLPRQHQSALHLPRLPEPPTHDLIYTRNARASTSPRSIGFCVIWDCISSSSSLSLLIFPCPARVLPTASDYRLQPFPTYKHPASEARIGMLSFCQRSRPYVLNFDILEIEECKNRTFFFSRQKIQA